MKAFLAVLSFAIAGNSCHAFYINNNNYDDNQQQQLVRVERQLPAYPAPEPAYGLPANYDFEWMVKDDYSRNDFGHRESRKDQQTQGSYHVALPDGRVQTVTYSVDGYGGYVADVTYSGQAIYPEVTPYAAPAPAPYKPAPVPVVVAAPVPAPTPAPYTPQPVVAPVALPYQPTPAPYRPQPAPYRPQPAPYRPQPVQPYAAASVQSPTYAAAPGVRRYSFKPATDAPVAEEAPAPAPEAEAEAADVRSVPVEEISSAEVTESAPEAVNEESTSLAPATVYRYYY